MDAQELSNLKQNLQRDKLRLSQLTNDPAHQQERERLTKDIREREQQISQAESQQNQRQPQAGNPVGASTTTNQQGMNPQGGQGQNK